MSKSTEQLIRETCLFEGLDSSKFEKVLSIIEEVEYPKGTVFIKEGDRADAFYVVKEGVVKVFTFNDANQEVIHARLDDGGCIGEQALITAPPTYRNASVRTSSNVVLLKIDHQKFQEIIQFDLQLNKKIDEIGRRQLLNHLVATGLNYDLSKFLEPIGEEFEGRGFDSEEFETRRFDSEDVVFEEGSASDGAYYLLSGEVEVYIKDQEGKNQLIRTVPQGNFVGEMGVVKKIPRSATAKAKGPLATSFISSERFQRLYDDVPEIKSLVDAYSKVYESPRRGEVTQYIGEFMGMPATTSKFQLKDGNVVVASWIIGKNICVVRKIHIENVNKYVFETVNCYRELLVKDSELVGVLNFGEWDKLMEVYSKVLNEESITDEEIENFTKFGNLAPSRVKEEEKEEVEDPIVCNCMSIKRGELVSCIKNGAESVKQISLATGAGSVCGSCVPVIQALLGRPLWRSMQIKESQDLTEDVRAYRLVGVREGKLKDFKAGQYVVIQCEIEGNLIERCYTLTSSPGEPEFYEFAVKKEATGYFSRWLFANDKTAPMLRVSAPLGKYTPDIESSDPIVCFMAGIGITPGISFARAIEKLNADTPLIVHYSIDNENDVVYRDELHALSKKYSNITYIEHLTKKDGRLTPGEVTKLVHQFPSGSFFLCGPEGYEKMVETTLKDEGIEDSKIFTEKFIHASS